jgi:hypothetical protein
VVITSTLKRRQRMEDAIFAVVPLLGLCLRRRLLDRALPSRETALLEPEVLWAPPFFSDEVVVASRGGLLAYHIGGRRNEREDVHSRANTRPWKRIAPRPSNTRNLGWLGLSSVGNIC